MRNLKRALSLTLASVMLLGMMVVGSSALSFNDADDISNVTAATVLQELGVMVGNDGNFMPEAPVSRAQMAIIICRILYGPQLNISQFEGTTQYTDVPAYEYYNGYVNLASSLGIINGYGDGRFGPDDTVTTAQAALMLCRALGWFQAGEMTGNWGSDALTAIAKATDLKMFGNLKLSTNALLSRDNVAEMTFNAMTKSNPVQYSERWGNYFTDEGGVVQGVKFDYADTLAFKNFDLVYDDSDTNIDEFGRPIVEWGIVNGSIKTDGNTGNISEKPKLKTSIIKSSDEADATYTAEVKANEIYKDLGLSKEVGVKPVTDGQEGAEIKLNRSNDDDKLGGNGVLVEAYKKDDSTVVITVINTYLAQATEDFDDKDEEVDVDIFGDAKVTDATLELEDFAVSNVKEDDYLLVTLTKDKSGNLDAIQTVSPAKSLSEVTVTAARDNDYVTVDGQRYKYNNVVKKNADAQGQEYIQDADKYSLKDGTYNLYLDPYGYVLGVEEAKGEANVGDYLIVVKDGVNNGYDARVRVMFTDGAEKTITVSKVDDSKASDAKDITAFAEAIKEGTFYTFKEKSGEYELKTVPAEGKNKVTSPSNGSKGTVDPAKDGIDNVADAIGTGNIGNSKTLFIADGKTYTGVKNAPEVKSGNNIYYVLDKDGKLLIVWTSAKGSTSSSDLVYILDVEPQVSRDNDVYTYKAIVNGEEKEIETSNETIASVGLYEVSGYDSDGLAELEAKPVTADGKDEPYADDETYDHAEDVAALEGNADPGYVKVDDTTYELADKYQIISVDGTTVNENVRLSSLKRLNADEGFTSVILVREKNDADAKVIAVYVIKPDEGGKEEDEITEISSIDFKAFTKPANDGVVANPELAETVKGVSISCAWTDKNGAVTPDGTNVKFATANNDYTLVITLTVEKGYKLAEKVTVAKLGDVTGALEGTKITYTFTVA